ncbi:AFR368Cp [Eremothecium gossypii ATCC 10895]|uniref:AFR368Cp n=1 Tax=Eremothecium gossypii (strain ATCC 10895 / CBS 109.51 / FGSC 9923 / NRRL Y-1056) TaxID=284811 RepID=Q753Q0_EREGS|nr:AFR368Cp [Eremothecium gossypii ATCC 10895]AAS53739.1 AFR368Cp [Eremothecium gossypii ATCC 10895]AEY98052.1 FAFR368Cp [Eremothecium gossypii FDAG1]
MGVFSVSGKLLTAILLAGNTLLLLFIVFSGSIESSPIDRLYWLRAQTDGFNGAFGWSKWTFWGLCNGEGAHNRECGRMSPAYPLSPADNFGGVLPARFVEDQDTFFYLSRFAFCFFWIALSFIAIAFLFCVFTWCSYSFTKVVFTMVLIGCVFNVAAVACQTAVVVMARNVFRDDGREAKIGPELMGIAWASVACSLLVFFFSGISFIRRAWTAHKEYVEMQHYKEQALKYQGTKHGSDGQMDHSIVYDTNPELEGGAVPVNDVRPVQAPVAEPQRHQSGVKFFKIRKTKNTVDDESL